jgi:hypothetical protein
MSAQHRTWKPPARSGFTGAFSSSPPDRVCRSVARISRKMCRRHRQCRLRNKDSASWTINVQPRRSGGDGAADCWRPQHQLLGVPPLDNAQRGFPRSPVGRVSSFVSRTLPDQVGRALGLTVEGSSGMVGRVSARGRDRATNRDGSLIAEFYLVSGSLPQTPVGRTRGPIQQRGTNDACGSPRLSHVLVLDGRKPVSHVLARRPELK